MGVRMMKPGQPPPTRSLVSGRVTPAPLAAFAPGPLDGVYGEQTVAAVRAFQIARRLVPDGEAGPATMKALERAGR